jgi:predicted nucleic acid-binding protein
VIVDAGPLVAFLAQNEAHHAWAREKFSVLPAPFLTCEPVLTEVLFLVSRRPEGPRRFFDFLDSGLLKVDFRVLDEKAVLRKLIQKYGDLPMSLADACLVRLAELHPGAAVFTLDAHFRLYRKHGRQQIPTIMP